MALVTELLFQHLYQTDTWLELTMEPSERTLGVFAFEYGPNGPFRIHTSWAIVVFI